MSESGKLYTLADDEQATSVMVYTMTGLCWGDVVTKKLVRVNTYLRTLSPDYVSLYDARLIPLAKGDPGNPLVFPELHVCTPKVIAFHLLPPASEPFDYDPAEENRKMEPSTVMVGPFRIDGDIRMSTLTNLSKFLEITRVTYLSIYDAEVTCPGMSALGVIRTPLVLIRLDAASFAPRQ